MKKIFALFLLLTSFLMIARAEEGIQFFEGTFNEALNKAKTENKLLFLDCYTTWCGPCKWMAAHVFTNDTVYNYFNNKFVCYKLDMEKGEGIDAAKRYAVKNYPTYLWIDASGKQVHRSVGSTSASAFLKIATAAGQWDGNLAYLEEQYKSGNRRPGLLLSYSHALKDAYDMRYQTVADDYFHSVPVNELQGETSWKTILEFTPNINSYVYGMMTKSPQPFYDKYGKDSVQKVMDILALESLHYAAQQNDSLMLGKAMDLLKAGGNKEMQAQGAEGELDYYKRNKNMMRYTALAPDYVKKYFWNDAKALNAVCWTYFMRVDDKSKLADAAQWIAQSVKLEDQYYNTDTYANLLHKMGKNKEAADMAQHSIDMAKKSGEDSSSTKELLDNILKESEARK